VAVNKKGGVNGTELKFQRFLKMETFSFRNNKQKPLCQRQSGDLCVSKGAV
jgi:hypothetical protein